MENLEWEKYDGYDEADLESYLSDEIFDGFDYIECTIRKYKTVYTIAAKIDNGCVPAFDMYDKEQLAYSAGAGIDFYKLGSWKIAELTPYEFVLVIKDINLKLTQLITGIN